jgi:hypothetical protein
MGIQVRQRQSSGLDPANWAFIHAHYQQSKKKAKTATTTIQKMN